MDYKKVNDYEVMYMISENDDDSRELLFKKYLPIVNKISSKYLGFAKKVGIEFDDLLQEGMIALNSAISKFDESNGVLFYTYASVCIERHLITYCKRSNNKKNYYLNYSSSVIDDNCYSVEDVRTSIDTMFSERMLEESFTFFKNLFDIKHSSVFELRYNGFSYKEISELLDIPVSTVDGRMYRVRQILHERYKFMA